MNTVKHTAVSELNEQLQFQIALTLLPNVGCVLAKNLVSYCGSVERVFREKKQHLLKIPGIGGVIADSIVNHNTEIFNRAEKEIEFIEKYKIKPLFFLDKEYPQRLLNCSDGPILLFYKGNADLNQPRFVALVGTRNATEYGKTVTENLVKDFADKNVVIVSGLAYGIDICAHKAALKNNLQTIGVLAHGLDRIYPSVHKSAAQKMTEQGGLLTEFLTETNPDRENFPQRNRIVAGISDAVVVIEAAEKGGALITAQIADSYNRDVFAVPGRTSDTYSQGCNRYIKMNKAALCESATDILKAMNWDDAAAKEKKQPQRKLFIEFNSEEKILVDLLNERGQLNIDVICHTSNLPVSKVAATLLNLEFNGILKSLPGKMYELV